VSALRGAGALYRAHLLAYRRTRTALFWSVGFPLVFLLVFGFVFGRGDADDTRYVMPGLLTITILSGSLFGVTLRLVSERELGILRRLRVTPVSAVAVVLSHGLTALTILAMSVAVQLLVARLVFRFQPRGGALDLAVVLLVGACALIPLGLLVGSIARDTRSAPVITNLLFFPFMFLSGAAFPFWMLPDWMQRAARLMPTTYVNEALHGIVVRGRGVAAELAPLALLAGIAVVAVGVNGWLFRWESEEPVRRGRVAIVLGALALVLAIGWLAVPALDLARGPRS
jgi:ABC-2 type transport system permease protein